MESYQKYVQFSVSAGPEVHVRVCVEHMSAARPLNVSLRFPKKQDNLLPNWRKELTTLDSLQYSRWNFEIL